MKEGQEHRKKSGYIGGNTDTAFLKLLALALMLVDHIGASLFPRVMELRVIGRMAFPLYAWCLVVGSVKTKSPFRYIVRLLMLAVISQPLYMMALNHTWADMNILFTLAIALTAIQGIRAKWLGSQLWVPILCYMLLGWLKADYGWKGITFILLLYFARESRSGLFAAYVAYSLFWGGNSTTLRSLFGIPLNFLQLPGIGSLLSALFKLQGMIWLALPLILFPTKSKIRLPKWLGYGLYPLHLILLIVLKLTGGYTLTSMINVF